MAEINWAAIREDAMSGFTVDALPPTMQLPALPHAVTQFIQKSNDPKATLKELARIIETDTGLTLELLRHVNSAFVGLRQKAGNVQHALSLLGLRQTKSLLIAAGMQAAIKARQSRLINQSAFWNASLQKALFAREVAKLLRADPDTAFAGALLQDYLLPVITNDLVDDYLRFLQTRERQPATLCDFEQQTFGWNHALAAACLAHRWHLPDDLVCCILFHHQGLRILGHAQIGRTACAAVALSGLLPDQLRQHIQGLEHLLALEQKWKAFNLLALAEAVDRQHTEMGLGVRNDYPLARRCQPVITGAHFNDGTLAAAS